jgi:hypothetical protein
MHVVVRFAEHSLGPDLPVTEPPSRVDLYWSSAAELKIVSKDFRSSDADTIARSGDAVPCGAQKSTRGDDG